MAKIVFVAFLGLAFASSTCKFGPTTQSQIEGTHTQTSGTASHDLLPGKTEAKIVDLNNTAVDSGYSSDSQQIAHNSVTMQRYQPLLGSRVL